MNPPGASRIFLRAAVPRMRLTSVQRGLPANDAGSVTVGQRLAWAACLGEFEQVEVHNLTRGIRLICHLRFGPEGKVHLNQIALPLMQPGDEIRLSAYGWLPPDAVEGHSAILVVVDDNNTVTEFRRMTPRTIRLDPFSFPPPPAIDVIVDLTRRQPLHATD